MQKNVCLKTRARAQINFASFDIEGIMRRLRNGTCTQADKAILASFSGTYLRYWQDIRALTDRGIIRQ